MTDHIQKNVIQFYSNLETFRITQRYTDLTIECDENYFQCHRLTLAAASRFFDSMFASTFKERKEDLILIREVSATTLGDVLQFIYTGDVTVTSVNVCNLFKASKFFELTGIADLCLEFVEKNKMTVNTTLEMYSLVCQDKNEMLQKILSQDIANEFKIFAKASAFLEIPFDNLKIILDKLSSSTENEEVSLGAICRWFFHSRKERSVNFDQLYRTIRFGSVSTEVTKFLTSKLYKSQDADEFRVEIVNPVGYDDFVAMPRITKTLKSTVKKLHLFVRSPVKKCVKIFSIDGNQECTNSGEVHLKDVPQWMRTIALDDYLYCLHYVRRNTEKENDQTFRMYTSVRMDSMMELNNPPVIFGDVNLCRGRNNNVYAYNQTLFHPLLKTDSRCSVLFSEEEMNRGIYLYNADLDIWLPVPAMQKKVEDACMTTHNGLLYLIGGNSDPINPISARFVQTYDCREGMWRALPNTYYDRVGADCCVFNEMIYVCGGRQITTFERYNPTGQKWECFMKNMNVEMQYHQLISYNRKLWAIGGIIPGSTSIPNLSTQNYPNEIISSRVCHGCSTYFGRVNNKGQNCKRAVYASNMIRRPPSRMSASVASSHTPHRISSTSEDNWVKRDLIDPNSTEVDAILDCILF